MKQTSILNRFLHNQKRLLKITATAAILLLIANYSATAQDRPAQPQRDENYGHTLNLGVGVGYYGYIGYSVPFLFANYEFNVARSFTLAPFIGVGSYRSEYAYDYHGYYYYYHETVVPIGIKGTYYFDRLLNAGPKWDFYLAASLGFVYDHITWDDGYYGDRNVSHSASPLYLDGHIGAEYHFNRKVGMYLDVSTGVSTIGVAFDHL